MSRSIKRYLIHVFAHSFQQMIYIQGFCKMKYIVIHTMEMILGIPPMTQYDAAAPTMWRCFNNQPDTSPFTLLPCLIDLSERNPTGTKLAALSKGLDFSKEDIIDDQKMNIITWKAVKGEDAIMPSPVRAAFFKPFKKTKDDDD